MVKTATKEIQPIASISVDAKDADLHLQRSRLTAGVGHPLAVRLNTLLNGDARPVASTNGRRFAVRQRKGRDRAGHRFHHANIARALCGSADDAGKGAGRQSRAISILQSRSPALQMRGIQMIWYSPADSVAAEKNTKAILERVLRAKPSYVPAL